MSIFSKIVSKFSNEPSYETGAPNYDAPAAAGAPVGPLTKEGKLDLDAIRASAGGKDLPALLAAAVDVPEKAAIMIAMGLKPSPEFAALLVPFLATPKLPGRAAAWALGQMDGAQASIVATLAAAKSTGRQNAYQALAILAARGKTGADLPDILLARFEDELARARSGAGGLGDQVVRILAILGHPKAAASIEAVHEADRFADRSELERLRTEIADNGKAKALIADLTQDVGKIFADVLVPPPAPPAVEETTKATTKTAAPKGPAAKQAAPLPNDQAEEGAAPAPIDWKDALASPEIKALDAGGQKLIGQLGPMLEQVAQQALQAPLTDLSGEEFAGVILQVLPQALPPQAVQVALHPQAFKAYQALGNYVSRTTGNAGIIDGVKLMRKALQEHQRSSGMLGGPDYSDPDEKPKK